MLYRSNGTGNNFGSDSTRQYTVTKLDISLFFIHFSSYEFFDHSITLHRNSDGTKSKNFLITYQSI